MPAVNIRPLADHVVLRPIEEKAITRGGLLMPATTSNRPRQGEVVAAGPGRFVKGERVPMELAIGQTVLFGAYTGTEVTLDGLKYIIIEETEVLVIIGV